MSAWFLDSELSTSFEMMLVEMFSKTFFQNQIYWDVFENLTFRK